MAIPIKDDMVSANKAKRVYLISLYQKLAIIGECLSISRDIGLSRRCYRVNSVIDLNNHHKLSGSQTDIFRVSCINDSFANYS